MRWNCAFLFYCLFAFQPALGGEIVLHIGSQTISAEIAATPEIRNRGLMQRNRLCDKCGMLFVFPTADRHGFWMKDTHLPLSIAFIARDGSIINIAEMQPNTTDPHYAKDNALYALEMNRGWFSRHRIKVGDRVLGVNHVTASH